MAMGAKAVAGGEAAGRAKRRQGGLCVMVGKAMVMADKMALQSRATADIGPKPTKKLQE